VKIPRLTKNQMLMLRALMRQSYVEGMYDGLDIDNCEDECDAIIQRFADEYIGEVMGDTPAIDTTMMN
jgi:hypothetical protein